MPIDLPTALRGFDLSGRVAVVTGASSGLGAGVARALASVGARVAVVARRLDRLEALAADIDGLAVACDLGDAEQVAGVIPRVVEGLGGPEILVNAAGNIFSREPAERESLADIRRTLDLNLVAPFLLAQAVMPHMVTAGRGSIINVSSISGHVGVPGIPQASYAATKVGLSGLTAELAVQWARHSIRVNTIAPGFFRSEITEDFYDSDSGRDWLRRNTPLPSKEAPTTSSAPSSGSRATPAATRPAKPSPSTAAGPPADVPAGGDPRGSVVTITCAPCPVCMDADPVGRPAVSDLLDLLGRDDPDRTVSGEYELVAEVCFQDRPAPSVEEAVAMLRAAPRDWSHLQRHHEFEAHLVLFAARGADPRLTPILEEIAPQVRTLDGRVQVIRSMLEVAARADSAAAAEAGLRFTRQFAQTGRLQLTERHDPLYWLYRQPVHPEIVLPMLEPLLRFGTLIPEVLRVRAAYRRAGFGSGAPVTEGHVAEIAELGDEAFVSFATNLAQAIGPALPREMINAADAWSLHNEVLNGGFAQYFWNTGGRRLGSAARGFGRLGLSGMTALVKAARRWFDSSVVEFQAAGGRRDLDAWSAWCSTGVFEDLDSRYVVADAQHSVLAASALYFNDRRPAIVDALNA